jgi:hypothetical protein
MKHTTYSFLDLAGSIHHPVVGDYLFTGEGVGSVSVSKVTDRSSHDVASDGSIMVSKIAGNNGTVTIEAQQTSPLQKWLQDWFNQLVALPTSEWATTSILLKNTSTGGSHLCTGVSPQKEGDVPYQAQGSRVTWTLMCADIQNNPV